MLSEQKTEKEHRLPLTSDPTLRSLSFYMNTVCECCLAAYCSCLGPEGFESPDLSKLTAAGSVTGSRDLFFEDSYSQHHANSLQAGFQKHWKVWNSSQTSLNGCAVHSRCSFCSRPLFQSGQHERSVKRKFAKVYVQEQLEERRCSVLKDAGDVDQEGMKSPKKHKDVLVESARAERMEVCEEELRQFKEALQAERDTVNALYMELEQERNAAAVAATETLAMITRLQEEKAAVQMEARQYKRMVEERSVYDEEAIDMLNEILAKQEEEKNALEKEVEMYKGTQLGKKRLLDGEDESLRLLEDSGGSRLSACGDSKSDYMTPFGSDSGTVGGCSNTVYQSRNLLESFYSVGEGCKGRSSTEHASARFERVGPDGSIYRRCKGSVQKCTKMDYAPGSENSRGSPSRVTRGQMDIDDEREDSGASGVHDIYEVPRQNSSSGGREEKEYGVGWRSDEFNAAQGRRQTMSPVSRTPQRRHDRLGKPDAMPGNSGMYSNSMIQPTSRGEARAGSLVQRNGDLSAELRQLSLRLQALEADRGFMEHNLGSRKNGNDDMQLLEEISQQLRQFQALDRTQDDMKELLQPEASFVFSFKGFFSFNGLRQSLHSHINRLACMFLKHTDAGLSYGDHVGLSHLLESSRKARAVPCITRGIKVDAPPFAPNPSYMLPRQNVHWPMDARGRSETAFSGWDY